MMSQVTKNIFKIRQVFRELNQNIIINAREMIQIMQRKNLLMTINKQGLSANKGI